MIVVRPVAATDANEWLQLRHALWPEGNLEEHRQDVFRYFAGDRREPAEVLLAILANGAPVGLAELSLRNIVDGCATDNVAYLEGWYVKAEVRRQGVGRALLEASERWARRQGCTEFGSDADLDNELSHVVHLGLGFEETGRLRTFRKSIGENS